MFENSILFPSFLELRRLGRQCE